MLIPSKKTTIILLSSDRVFISASDKLSNSLQKAKNYYLNTKPATDADVYIKI